MQETRLLSECCWFVVTSHRFLPLTPSLRHVNLLYVDRIRIETGVVSAMNITLHFRSTATPTTHTHENPYSPRATPPPRHDTHTKRAPFMYMKSFIPIALKVQIHSTHINANYVWASVYCIFTTVGLLSPSPSTELK